MTDSKRECWYCGDTFETLQGLGQHSRMLHGEPWLPRSELVEMYESNGQRTETIAKRHSTTSKTIRKLLDEYGIEQRDALAERRRGLNLNPSAFHTMPQGYERWTNAHREESNKVYVHRLLAVAEYGFDSVSGMEVHHNNGIPWDNRPDNITLKDPSEHGRMHANERWESEKSSA